MMRTSSTQHQQMPQIYHHPSFGNPEHHMEQMRQQHLGQVMEEDANTLTSKDEDFTDSEASPDS